MSGFLVTYHPVFRNTAMRELECVDPDLTIVGRFGASVSYIEPSLPESVFVRALKDALPIFVRHVAPVHLDVPLSNDDDALAELVEACSALPGLLPGVTFAVQCRKLDGAPDALSFKARDVEVRLGLRLEGLGFEVDMSNPAQVVSVALADGRAYAGASLVADNLSDQADEYRRYSRWPAAVSRAEYKLREALEVWGIELPAGGRALDVGAAPGGWSVVLAGAGLRVVAVDPADLAEPVASNPQITHVRARIESAPLEPESFDIVVNDMNLDPDESAALMCAAADRLVVGAPAVMTIKVPVRRPLVLLRQTLAILQFAYEVRGLRNLFHNRQEVTAYLCRKPHIDGTFEDLIGHDPQSVQRRRDWHRGHRVHADGEGTIPLLLRRREETA